LSTKKVKENLTREMFLLRGRSPQQSLPLRRLRHRFQLERLARFAQKFGPEWRPRHLVFTARTRLPVAAVRVLQAEAYLPARAPEPRGGAWRPAPAPHRGILVGARR